MTKHPVNILGEDIYGMFYYDACRFSERYLRTKTFLPSIM